MPKVGDIFEVSLQKKSKVYGQYVFLDKEQGPLVQIFSILLCG